MKIYTQVDCNTSPKCNPRTKNINFSFMRILKTLAFIPLFFHSPRGALIALCAIQAVGRLETWDWKGALASRTLINHRRCDSIMWKIRLSSEVASTRDKRGVNGAWNEKKGFFPVKREGVKECEEGKGLVRKIVIG